MSWSNIISAYSLPNTQELRQPSALDSQINISLNPPSNTKLELHYILFDDWQEATVIITPKGKAFCFLDLLRIHKLNFPKSFFIFTYERPFWAITNISFWGRKAN